MAFALKFYAGAKPGVKRKLDSENKSKKLYELTRERDFQPAWQKTCNWLVHENGKMFCTWCKEINPTSDSSFVKGCDNLRIDTLKTHEKSKQHLRSADRHVNVNEKSTSEATSCLTQLNKSQIGQLSIKMRTAHFIAKHHKSFLDYKHICQLDKMKGLDVGTSYTTDKGAATLLQSISSVTRTEVCQNISNAKFFSFTCDGSSDFTGDDYESIYVRTCTNGTILDQFLSIGIAESASSRDIHVHICDTFTRLGLGNEFQTKLVGFCSDGASNMQGHKSGLVALLRKTLPHIVTVHCLAHRLELAFKDTIKKFPPYEKMMTLLLGLYYLYRKSPKLKMGLKRSFEAYEMKMLLPTRVGGTRWLPHLTLAIRNFIRGYKAVRSHLESSSHSSPKAEGLAKLAADSNLLSFVLSLQEVIQPLVRLSLNLQKDDQTLADAHCHVAATQTVLSHLPEREFENIKEVETGVYQGLPVKQKGRQSSGYVAQLVEYILGHIASRFPISSIIGTTAITSLKNWPTEKSAIQDYGSDEVKAATAHFQSLLETSGVEVDLILGEWQLLKNLVTQKYGDKMQELSWKAIHNLRQEGLENCLTLIDLLRTLPSTSVKNESSFSIMKLTKGKRRPRMKSSTLNDLLTVSLISPSVSQFDPSKSIEHFLSSSVRPRRVDGYERKIKKAATVTVVTIDDEPEEDVVQTDLQEDVTAVLGKDLWPDTSDDEESDDEDMDYSESAIDRLLSLYTRE